MQVGATSYDLPPIFAANACYEGGCGTDDVCVRQLQAVDPFAEAFAEQEGFILATLAVLVAIGEFDELTERRVVVLLPRFDFGSVEFGVGVARGGVDAEVLRVEGLNNHMPGLFTTTGTACDLCK